MGSFGNNEDLSTVEGSVSGGDFTAILGRLRSQLLDLTARNRLVNFRYTRRSLRFVGVGLDWPYKALLSGKSLQLQYVPLPSDEEASEHLEASNYANQLGLSTSYELEYSHASTSDLQTLQYPKNLDRIVRVMREENRLAIDEAGSHILFLVSGFLQYTLTQGDSASKHIAPLLLLPVQFRRGEVDPISGLYTYHLEALEQEEAVRDNITLREKLNYELGFQLPIYKDEQSPSSYLQEVADACNNQKGWQVLPHLSLVLLSFKKIALWADLDIKKDQMLIDHPLMQKLFGIEKDGVVNEGVLGAEEEYSVDEHPLAELPCIYDSDSSQHQALIDALEGKNLVIVGPPGTGKSQTITNLIATAMGRGKSVLFISEKKAALDVVSKRLEAAGLAPFCLELHSNKSCKKVVLESIEQRLNQTFLPVSTTRHDLMSLREMRQQLNAHAKLMNRSIDIPGEPTMHDVLWKIEKARQSLGSAADGLRVMCWSNVLQWRADDVSLCRKILADFGRHFDQLGCDAMNHPLCGIALKSFSSIDKYQIKEALQNGALATVGLLDTLIQLQGNNVVNSLSIESWITWKNNLKLISPFPRIGIDFAYSLNSIWQEESQVKAIRDALILIRDLSSNLVESNKLFSIHGEVKDVLLMQSPIDDVSILHLGYLEQHFALTVSQAEKLLPFSSFADLEKLVIWLQSNERHQFGSLSLERIQPLLVRFSGLLNNDRTTEPYRSINDKVLSYNDIENYVLEAERLAEQLDRGLRALFLLQQGLGLKEMRVVTLDLLKVCHEIFRSAPCAFSFIRTLSFGSIDGRALADAIAEIKTLIKDRQALSMRFFLDKLPTTELLEVYLQTSRKTGWRSFLCRDVIRAKKICSSLLQQVDTNDPCFHGLDQLLLWCKRRDEFLNDSIRKKLFEGCFAAESKVREDLEDLLSWLDVAAHRLQKIPDGHEINLFVVSDDTIQRLETSQEYIHQLIQVDADLSRILSIVEPHYRELEVLISLAKPVTPISIKFTVLAEVYQCLTICYSELDMLGQRVDRSSSWSDLRSVLQGQLSNIELTLQRFQALAPTSLTPRQIKAAIHARERFTELISSAQAKRLLSLLIFSSNSLDCEHLAIFEKILIWGLQIAESGIPSSLVKKLFAQPMELNGVCDALDRGGGYLQQWESAVEKLQELCAIDRVLWLSPNKELSLDEIHSAKSRFEKALTWLDRIDIWVAYNKCRETGVSLGLTDLIHHLERGRFHAAQLTDAFDYVYYHSCLHLLHKQIPNLSAETGYTLESIRQRFSAMDQKIIRLNGTILAADIARRHVPEGRRAARASEQTEQVLLKHEIGKTSRHLPIRQLMAQAGRAIQALKPCFLMSPLSVAQYLPKSALTFDLLVIDEASQMRLPEAFGAVLRSKQIVVVGDPKQLPPSSFFEEVASDDGDEDEEKGAIEDGVHSILERCLQVFKSPRQLRWHYRSQHQNLIAFSNYHFYDNRLIVLPACHTDDARLGVYYNYIPDAVYINRSNRTEAEKIVEAVIFQLLKDSLSSVGVITLNQPQREMIEDIFEQKLREIPALREVVDQFDACGKKVFIRNLENVQGDERDIIFISTVYGKMPGSSVVRQTFGPINGSAGWRRLNVLFTRARQRIELYSSMQPEDIILSEQSSLGHRILKHYLEFAQKGQLAPINPSFGETENPFEEAIADLLRRHGYEVHPQLGVQGYWIDIAVRHPDRPDEYLAAIECDGATYHSSRSARDRDRIRQQLLEALGWRGKIFRIWSTDWFTNPVNEAERLLDFLALLRFPKPRDD